MEKHEMRIIYMVIRIRLLTPVGCLGGWKMWKTAQHVASAQPETCRCTDENVQRDLRTWARWTFRSECRPDDSQTYGHTLREQHTYKQNIHTSLNITFLSKVRILAQWILRHLLRLIALMKSELKLLTRDDMYGLLESVTSSKVKQQPSSLKYLRRLQNCG